MASSTGLRPQGVREVAELAGVSVGTVSNVLNRPERVRQDIRSRVEAALREVGYVRNDAAIRLRGGSGGSAIGLVVLDVRNPYYTELARGVEDVAARSHYFVTLCNSDDDEAKQTKYLQGLFRIAAGVILTPSHGTNDASLRQLAEGGIPAVVIDHVDPAAPVCAAHVDDRVGGALALHHLSSRGHKSIAYVTGPLSIRACAERLQGAREALTAAGRDPDSLLVVEVPTPSIDAGRRAGEQLLARSTPPTAAMCANDLLAMGVQQAVLRSGRSVPGDLAIIGYDDIEFASAAAVPLTSVRQPIYELGVRAAEMLMQELTSRDDHVHEHVTFMPSLVERMST